ncbi:MAG: helix-turn-helix transcriptional regulator [Gemmatimonadetes bacterium]|nr:helix-turn-helix transcriptional regulator [Gemmatimonadota bacterium]
MRVRTPVDFGLMIRQARRSRGMTQQQLARAAAVGRQWIVEIEAGKPRAELGRVLQTLAALDLSLTMHGEGIPELRKSGNPLDAVDLQDVLDVHRRTPS